MCVNSSGRVLHSVLRVLYVASEQANSLYIKRVRCVQVHMGLLFDIIYGAYC